MCVILYLYTATCGPKGHGSGGIFYITLSCPRPKRLVLVGHPYLLAPIGRQTKERNTSRPTANALSRGPRWGRATRAHTGRPNARIAGRPMGRGRTPVLPRGRPACPPGGGGHRLPHAGSGGRRGLCSLPRARLLRLRPRSLKGIWVRRRSRRRSGPPRKKWRSRGAGSSGWSLRFLGSVFLFPLFRRIMGGRREGSPSMTLL